MTPGTSNDVEAKDIQYKLGFRYIDIPGEILFPYVSGRPDISYAVVELSNFSDNPAECHYVSIKRRVVRYLRKEP